MPRWTLLTLASLLLAPACIGGGGKDDDDEEDEADIDFESLCEEIVACLDTSYPGLLDVDTCVADNEAALDEINDDGCGSEYARYTDCFQSNAVCVDGIYTAGSACDDQLDDYQDCLPTTTRDTDDTGAGPGPGDDDDDDTTTVPFTFEASVTCPRSDTVEMWVTASVDSGSKALIDAADTRNANNYYETHTLLPVSSGNGLTEFAASMPTSTGIYVDGGSSIFSCDPDVHYDTAPGDIMTYIVRAYDSGGALWDCFASGHDPDGMLAGDYDDFGNTIDYSSVSPASCSTSRRAR